MEAAKKKEAVVQRAPADGARMYPHNSLKRPVRELEDTLSVFTVLKERFFVKKK